MFNNKTCIAKYKIHLHGFDLLLIEQSVELSNFIIRSSGLEVVTSSIK